MSHFCHGHAMAVKTAPPIALATASARVGSSAIRDLLAITEQPHVISMAGGLPLASGFPVAALAEATAHVLREEDADALQYSTTPGHPGLRAWVADRAGADSARVVVTHGSQQALELVIRALVDPGATVALADPAYVGALQALRLNGADLLPIPSDRDGLCVDVLADRLATGARPALVYVVSNFDNPTGATLTLDRRQALAVLADRFGFVIVDDDPYAELRWGGERLAPIASMTDRVVTLGSTSKILCPGLRVGWAVAPPAVADHLVLLKQATDLHTATFNQRVVHRVLTMPGFLDAHLPVLRATYEQHAVALRDALAAELGDRVTFTAPDGGMFVWVRTPGIDPDALLPRAIDHGTAFVPGSAFAVTGRPTRALRLSFATADPAGLHEAVHRLAQTIGSV
jgi:2-aminoadipate transaminase